MGTKNTGKAPDKLLTFSTRGVDRFATTGPWWSAARLIASTACAVTIAVATPTVVFANTPDSTSQGQTVIAAAECNVEAASAN